MALVGPFSKGFAVNFKSGGDTTRDAFGKHIQEIDRIYGYLNALDAGKVSADEVSNIAKDVTTLTNKVNALSDVSTKLTALTKKVDDLSGSTSDDITDIAKDIAQLKADVEANKPVTLKYRIMEAMYSPVIKGSPSNIIQDTWVKGTDTRLAYADFEGDSKYRVFTVPKGVYKVVISACGGGGGGYVMNNVFYSGGNASSVKDYIFDVTPNDKIYIYAGRGGRGCSKTLADDNTCSDGEDTEVRIGDSKSKSLIAEQIIHCQGGYSALTINSNPTNESPTVNGACQNGTSQAQTVSRPYPPALSNYADLKKLLMGFASESTLVSPYGAGGAFNTSWQRIDNYAGTHGIVIVKYIAVY